MYRQSDRVPVHQDPCPVLSLPIVILKGWEAIGGPTAAYPDIKAKVVGKVFDDSECFSPFIQNRHKEISN